MDGDSVMKKTSPPTLLAVFVGLFLALAAAACSTLPGASIGPDYLPGGVRFYSAGSALDKEYMSKHVKRVQYDYSLYASQRTWTDSRAGPVPSSVNMLQAYYPLHVRWELKDGRQFIAENIDIRGLMREYFKTHDIQMQWQREGREQGVGDSDPSLVYEVQEDEVIVKWFITINQTPLKERILPTGAATRWKFTTEQYVVGAVKGKPTTGIDFEQQWEFNRKQK
jgi:hypothetical protein